MEKIGGCVVLAAVFKCFMKVVGGESILIDGFEVLGSIRSVQWLGCR